MIITSKIMMDIVHRGATARVDAVQGDRNSRAVEFCLMADGTPWPVPENTVVRISYLRPDGSGGQYQTTTDGTRAWIVADNSVTVLLAPQVLETEGAVLLSVGLQMGQTMLHTFTVVVDVQGSVAQMIPQV